MSRISIIIPCHNEEKSIGEVVQKIKQSVPDLLEIIVVDNNCTDKTRQEAQKHGARVVEEKTKGYGAAIKRGLLLAKGDILVVQDGDGQYPSEKIPEMVKNLDEKKLDFISCNRFPLQNKESLPWINRFGNHIFNIITNSLFGLKLKDSQSGMWVFKKEVLNKIKLESTDMPLSEEIKIKVALNPEMAFAECSIPYYKRVGESKLFPLRHGLINLNYLLKLRQRLWLESGKPVLFSIGLALIVIVYLALTWQNIHAPFNHVTADVNGQNGMAAQNLVNHGFFKLKFGVYDKMLLDPEKAPGGFYTHHPEFFVLPTALVYKIFGVSEVTTRLGTVLIMLLGLVAFSLALRKILGKDLPALMITLIFSILPGVVFYGEAFELAVYSLPCALISFCLFIYYIYNDNKKYLYLFVLSLLVGGMMGWFYYLLPASIWLYVFFSTDKKLHGKKFLLIFLIPAFLLGAVILNLYHFASLNNGNIKDVIANLRGAFGFRASRQPFIPWFARIWSMLKLHSTWLYLLMAFIGMPVFVKQIWNNKGKRLLSVLLLFPVFTAAIFFQWSTHPFGVIYFLPIIAVFSGLLMAAFIEKNIIWGTVFTIIVTVFGLILSIGNLNYFFNKFIILMPEDIKLLQELKPNVNNDDICLGNNEMGIGFRGIADWYTQKRTLQSPECNSSTSKYAIIFHPSISSFLKNEEEKFEKDGYGLIKCTGYWCLMERKPIVDIQSKSIKK